MNCPNLAYPTFPISMTKRWWKWTFAQSQPNPPKRLPTDALVGSVVTGRKSTSTSVLSSKSGKLDMLDSGNSSGRLRQEAQMLGLRGWALPFSPIGSPQHLQIRGLILLQDQLAANR